SLSINDVSRGKPDPEPFRETARRLGAKPEATVAVEDSDPGARSARAAGLFVVGYAPHGNAFAGADRSVAKLMEVVTLFGI
ncbi:MAG TPA: HAD family hydrolase, partial [Roseiarcus sp.]|nr:HAD family hydrolase [Roseiarcus sp.]